jgi:hypothetical protein
MKALLSGGHILTVVPRVSTVDNVDSVQVKRGGAPSVRRD